MKTDVAALAVAVTAGAVVMFRDDFAFDWLSTMFGVTLLVTTVAYTWSHRRKLFESIALGLTVGFIGLAAVGWSLEGLNRLRDPKCEAEGFSCVDPWEHVVTWLVIAALTVGLDRLANRKRK